MHTTFMTSVMLTFSNEDDSGGTSKEPIFNGLPKQKNTKSPVRQ